MEVIRCLFMSHCAYCSTVSVELEKTGHFSGSMLSSWIQDKHLDIDQIIKVKNDYAFHYKYRSDYAWQSS